MKYHYVYRITNKLENKHYYGSRTSKIEPKKDIGIYYFSSSSNENFIKDQKDNPLNYSYKVVHIYLNRENAIKLEIKLHNKFNVGINESFYNKCKQTSYKFDTTGSKNEKMVKKRKLDIIDGKDNFQRTREKILSKYKLDIDENGNNKSKRIALKASETMRNKIDENGNNILRNKALKGQETMRNNVDENGLSLMDKKALKISQARTAKGKFYTLYKGDSIYKKNVPAKDVRKIASTLETCTKENYLGKSKATATRLTNSGKGEYVGLYSVQD